MLWDLHNQQKTHRNIHLIFGTRYAEGILYREEFEELVQKMSGFKFSVALSREETLPESQYWDAYKGYVHQVYQQYYPTQSNPNIDFYLCGWSNMIDDAVAKLIVEMGYDKSQIHYELYG